MEPDARRGQQQAGPWRGLRASDTIKSERFVDWYTLTSYTAICRSPTSTPRRVSLATRTTGRPIQLHNSARRTINITKKNKRPGRCVFNRQNRAVKRR
jgi:hypothetical protein